ncbi:unnamed protein product [Ilex paraguariensis]|uniref:Uncharacterized protein n=1 Tax=Ilex paraguariensis TaxID=185542 RepID=A0ABC8U8T1_9AQUA
MAETVRTTFFHRGWTNFFGQFNAASIDMRFNFLEEQHTSPSHHAVLAFIVAVIINLQQLKYQGKDETPFETHPKTMGVALTSLLLYFILSKSKLRFVSPTCANILCYGMELFGFLSLTSLASTLFPDSVMPVLYVAFILLSASELLQWFCWTVMGELGESGFHGRPIARHFIDSQRRGAHAFPMMGELGESYLSVRLLVRRLIDSQRNRAHAFTSERNILPV